MAIGQAPAKHWGRSYKAPVMHAPTPVELIANGIWTWFTAPVASVRNGALVFNSVNSAGTCQITRRVLSTGATSTADLSSVGLEVDDHNNGSHYYTADGRLVPFYGQHNDGFLRYKVAATPDSIASFSAEQLRGGGAGNISYPNPFKFSQAGAPELIMFRRNRNGASDRSLAFRTCSDFSALPNPVISGYTDLWASPTGDTPYWRMASDGINSVHVFATDRHPVQGQVSLYYLRMTLSGSNVWQYFKADGTEINAAALPFGPSDASQVYNGSSVKCWVSDAGVDATGTPVCLWMRYPNNDGTAIEYWHSRWNGSAWINTKICDDGAGLYSGEQYYPGGLCFDSADASMVYLSAPVSGVRQIQEWRTSDSGATWTKSRDITSGGTVGNPLRARPISPVNHGGLCRVLWWEGIYTTYISYSTSIKGLL